MLLASEAQTADVRNSAAATEIHPESLLQIPLVRQAFFDPLFRLVPRAVDANWKYGDIIPASVGGFNPFECAYFYGRESRFERWLSNPFASARELNESDLLVKEVLFMTHDYLHAWAYQAIDRLHPELQLFDGAITAETLETYAFCHLLTEAVATVGLDYWFLCERGVNDYCPIGSNMGPLTVSYVESRAPEYRRWHPTLRVQSPEFLDVLATFYCTGEFPGFGADDLSRSPQLLTWLQHELSYGVTQRVVTRSWLQYLADDANQLDEDELAAPIDVAAAFRRELIREVGQLLWAKVKDDDAFPLTRPRHSNTRRVALTKGPDFRFINLARVGGDHLRPPASQEKESLRYFLYQYVAGIRVSSVPSARLQCIRRLLERQDVELLIALLDDLPRIEPSLDEPRDLFLVN